MKRKRGFTLVELLVVITCVVLLVVLLSYAVVSAQEKARVAVCATNLRAVYQATMAYALDYSGWYPLHGTYAADSADIPMFPDGAGYWVGNADYPGSFWYGTNWKYAGIAQGLVNAGARFQDASKITRALPGTVYLNNGKTLYCPNQLEGPYFTTDSYLGFSVLDPNDLTSFTPIKTIQGSKLAYFQIPPTQRKAGQIPTIGYCAPNGNSPGYSYYDSTNTHVSNDFPRYRGRKMVQANGASFWGVDGGGNHQFAAGYQSDPPDTILMADNAKITGSSPYTLAISRSSRADYLQVNHDAGMNAVYNDGRVMFTRFKSNKVSSAEIYHDGKTMFGYR